MEMALLIFLYAAFCIGSPSFVIVACMGFFKGFVYRFFIYWGFGTLCFLLFCFFMYFFFVAEAFFRFLYKLGCTHPPKEPDISLGIMHCYTYLNVFLDFFAYPLIMVLMVTSLVWIAMCIIALMRYDIAISIKAIPKEFKRKSFLYGVLLYATELLLLGFAYIYARMTNSGNIAFVILASIFGSVLILVIAKMRGKRKS